MLSKENAYFLNLKRLGHEYEEARAERKARKQRIIDTLGWESEELKVWYEEDAAARFPFTQGACKAYRAWASSLTRQEDELEMDDFLWEKEVHDFVEALRGAGIGSFVYTNQSTAVIGTDSEGGFLVPDEYEHTLVQALEEENVLRSLCTIIQTSSGDRKIPVVASHGTASWVEEEGQIPESDDAFGQIAIGAHKVATMIKVSDELLQDSVFNIENYIAAEFARRIGSAEEEAFITGNGTAKPTGLLHTTNGAGTGVTTTGNAIIMRNVFPHGFRCVILISRIGIKNRICGGE